MPEHTATANSTVNSNQTLGRAKNLAARNANGTLRQDKETRQSLNSTGRSRNVKGFSSKWTTSHERASALSDTSTKGLVCLAWDLAIDRAFGSR